MPNATDMLGIGTLVLVILCFIGGSICLGYVLLFHFKSEKHHQHHQQQSSTPLHDFDSPWLVRVILVSLFMMWSLGDLLRLPWFREGGGFVHSLHQNTQENLCKIHLVWSLGLMEPALLLTILFLLHCSLNNSFVLSPSKANHNGRVFYLVLVYCLPLFILHLILVGISRSDSHHKTFGGLLPSYFTESHVVSDEIQFDKIVLCSYPLFSILALALFSMVFIAYFAILGYKLFHAIINRKLRARVQSMVLTVMILLPFHVIFLGVSVWMKPNHSAFEVVMLLRFLALLFCIMTAIGVLVVIPIFDAMAVFYLLEIREEPWQDFNAAPIEPLLGRPLSEGVLDGDDSFLEQTTVEGFFRAVSGAVNDGDVSSSRDGSLNSDVSAKDLTLGPRVWLVDVPRFIPSPHLSEERHSTIQ